jgi:hypothetical protein
MWAEKDRNGLKRQIVMNLRAFSRYSGETVENWKILGRNLRSVTIFRRNF